ncbi:MAG: ROK family transcriptional regulator [Clostridia bacterium]|nr:ROK family transcriptional regulator [Clostridia bacterium]
MEYANDRFQRINRQAKNLQLIKETNLTLVFNMIYKHRSISRAQLAKITKLSPTTISSQVDELLQKRLVVETGTGEMGTSGRKPIMININENGYYVISIELMEGGFNCCLYNLLCKRVDARRFSAESYAHMGDDLIGAALQILELNQVSEDKLIGITLAAPGLIDYESHRIISSTVVAVDESNDFYDALQRRFQDIPIFLENESGLSAYAEKVFGTGSDAKNLIFIDVGIGIGAGILLNGNMFRGSFGLAGEIGHITIDINGPKCKCGSRGCLEIMASIPAMIQEIVFAMMSGRETVISEITQNDLNKINIDVIRYAISKQDALALEVMKENARKFAFGINNVINMFNPQAIIIGGEIAKLGPVYLEQVKQYLSDIELKPNVSGVAIRYSRLKDDATTLGGARYALDTIFHTPKMIKSEIPPES